MSTWARRVLVAVIGVGLLGATACASAPPPVGQRSPSPAASPASGPTIPGVVPPEANSSVVVNPYYPIAKGNSWTFRYTAPGGSMSVTETIVKVSPVKGGYDVTFGLIAKTEKGQKSSATLVRRFLTDGTMQVSMNQYFAFPGTWLSFGSCTLSYPNLTDTSYAQGEGTGTATVGDEKRSFSLFWWVSYSHPGTVKTKAGTFEAFALNVSTTVDVPGEEPGQLRGTSWFAKGVGPVKSELPYDAGSVEMLLESYHVA
jgi:hypothetical protein